MLLRLLINAILMISDQSLMIPDLVYRTLGTGLHIASRHYQFLAWSNSQVNASNIMPV